MISNSSFDCPPATVADAEPADLWGRDRAYGTEVAAM